MAWLSRLVEFGLAAAQPYQLVKGLLVAVGGEAWAVCAPQIAVVCILIPFFSWHVRHARLWPPPH